MPIISVLCALLLILFYSFGYAAPSVTGVTGAVSHSGSIDISGSGFGTKSPAAPWLYDQVDNISVYSGVSDGSCAPVGAGYPWTKNQGDGHSGMCGYEISRTRTMRHSRVTAMYYTHPGGANYPPQLGNDGATVSGNNIYISWWQRLASTLNSVVSTKSLRLTDGRNFNSGVNTAWTNLNHEVFNSGTMSVLDLKYGEWNPTANTWHRSEYWSTPTNIVGWIDSTQRFSSDLGGYTASPPLTTIYHIGLDPGSSSGLVDSDMGEIYIDTTLARVEICSGSTWASKGTCEIQIPSAWSASSITATVNQGAFADSSSQYLYVVDAAGAANSNGYSITFDSSGGASSGSLRPGVSASGVTFR